MISALLTTSQKSPRKHERHFKQNTLKIIDMCDNKYVVVTGMSLILKVGGPSEPMEGNFRWPRSDLSSPYQGRT